MTADNVYKKRGINVMNDVSSLLTDALSAIYSNMDKDGFFPQSPCRGCGEMLSGQDGPRPAETYAGTFTGLCYRCQNAGSYPVGEPLPDGTRLLSYPPHCPSWRRDRETFWAHPDCEQCGGSGRHHVSRSDPQGGPYYVHCKTCLARVTVVVKRHELEYLEAFQDGIERIRKIAAVSRPGEDASVKDVAVSALKALDVEVYGAYEQMPVPYRPRRMMPLTMLNYGLKPADVKVKRVDTLLGRCAKLIGKEIDDRKAGRS